MAAKAVHKERKPVWEGINPNLLARPPRGGGGGNASSGRGGGGAGGGRDRKKDDVQAAQYRLWKRRLAYERSNPEVGFLFPLELFAPIVLHVCFRGRDRSDGLLY